FFSSRRRHTRFSRDWSSDVCSSDLDRLAVMLAGRVAEKLAFSEVSSGAESDLEQATKLARRMVARWGMSDALGPVAYQVHKEDEIGRAACRERGWVSVGSGWRDKRT